MKELGFKESFALVALNGLDPDQMTTAKRIALRSIAAAEIIEKYLDAPQNGLPVKELKNIWKISVLKLKKEEKKLTAALSDRGLLRKVPSLICCDMMYFTGAVDIFEYCSDETEYLRLRESMRAELLEDGEVSDETVCLWWLFRESGCFYDFFSKDERERVALRLSEIYRASALAKTLFSVSIQRPWNVLVNKYLKKKKEIFSTKLGNGFLFVFPYFERSESIFIDMEKWFSNSTDRLNDVLARLNKKGIQAEVVAIGSGSVIKVRNICYECVPATMQCQYPIQGIRLRRYVLIMS